MRDSFFYCQTDALPGGPVNPVPDHRSASTLQFDYILVDGLIYLRSKNHDDPKIMRRGELVSVKGEPDALAWQRLDGIGLPYNADLKSRLAPDEKIVEIDVASEIIVAVSNLDRVYLYKPTDPKRPLCWEGLLGSPDILANDKLFLPHDRRAWAFSCSVRTKPETRRTDFIDPQEIVSYFSDANGVRFDFGFTPTIYVLTQDGSKIVYWDTGLPPSFSRGFMVPEGVQGVSLSAAGSTVFLSAIDEDGKLHFYTRMIDYEINGACPGLKVAYTDIPIEYPDNNPDHSYYLGYGVRKMPLPGWVEHSVEDILPFVTQQVCIRLTGQGNEARELRIAAQHPEQGWGYYCKSLTESAWQFCPAPSVARDLDPIAYNPGLPKQRTMDYPCSSLKHATSGISMELQGFHPFLSDAEPCYLVINKANEPTQRLRLYLVDAWGLHFHHQYDEDLIGTVDGEPKALLGTLVLTPEQQQLAADNSTAIGGFIKRNFLEFHGKTKGLRFIADNHRIMLKTSSIDSWTFKRPLTEADIQSSFYVRKAMAPALTDTPVNLAHCKTILDKNKACLEEIRSIFSKRRMGDRGHPLIDLQISLIRPFASGFFKINPKPGDPTYEQAVEDINLPLRAHRDATSYAAIGKAKPLGYERAQILLKDRIKLLEQQLDLLKTQSKGVSFA